MNNKIVYTRIFNNILDELFEYLETTFPNFKSDIILAKATATFIRKGNPFLVVEQFMEYVGPYSEKIFKCDEDFFLNFEKSNIKDNLSQHKLLTGIKLRDIWLSYDTTDVQKASVFLMFQKLLNTGKMVFSK